MSTRRTPEELLRDAAADTAGAHMGMAKKALKDGNFAAGRDHLQKALEAVNGAPAGLFEDDRADHPGRDEGPGEGVGVGT